MPTTDINHLALIYGLLAEDIAILLELSLLLGIPLIIWLVIWTYSKLGEMDRELHLLTVGRDWGEVRLDKFAIRCSVHVAVARWYLNSKARQLNGLREVDELGDAVYLFGEAKRKFLQEQLELLSPEHGGTP
jgi:hypothetical protein